MKLEVVGRFPSRLEAEAIGHALDQYGIPFIVQSADIGMFGPGMIGSGLVGATLLVAEDRAEETRELLHCALNPTDSVEPKQ